MFLKPHLGAQSGSQEAQVLLLRRARLHLAEAGIRVLHEKSLNTMESTSDSLRYDTW